MREKPSTVLPVVSPQADAPRPKVGFVSLGCPKNLVDSEVMMGMLAQAGAELVVAPKTLTSSWSILAHLSRARNRNRSIRSWRWRGTRRQATRAKLVVAGCLVERFRDEIRKNIPEVDAVVGTGELESILAAAGIEPPRDPGHRFAVSDS